MSLNVPTGAGKGHVVVVGDNPLELKSSGIRILTDDTLLLPEGASIESASLNIGDEIKLSEVGGRLAIKNLSTLDQFIQLDAKVDKIVGSFRCRHAFLGPEITAAVQPINTETILGPMIVFNHTTALNAMTNSIKFELAAPVTNFRFVIRDTASGNVSKYIPNKANWFDGVGVSLAAGIVTIDFKHSQLDFTAGRELTIEVHGDGLAMKGNLVGVPYFEASLQIATFRYMAFVDDVDALTLVVAGKEAVGVAAGLLAAHTGAADPHGQYVLESQLGVAGGVAQLDGGGKVPASQLPSYVDDILEYANLAAFPGTGETGKQYVALNTNKTYRWSGSAYVEISPSPGSTDDVPEGAGNKYFTAARVLATVLTGLSTATNAVISATDTVLSALGKLQKQITDNLTTLTNHVGSRDSAHGLSDATHAGFLSAADWLRIATFYTSAGVVNNPCIIVLNFTTNASGVGSVVIPAPAATGLTHIHFCAVIATENPGAVATSPQACRTNTNADILSTLTVTAITVESKNTGVLIGGNVEGLEASPNVVCSVLIVGDKTP